MLFSKKSKFPIGLDISDLSIKGVQLQKSRGEIKIQALNKQLLQPGIIESGIIVNEKDFLNSLNKLISKPKFGVFSTEEIVVCLPETKTFVKTIKIDNNPNNIKDLIESQIQKNFPFAIEEIYYDWQIVYQDKNFISVLIGAAPRSIVDQYTRLFSQANLSIQAFEIEGTAICRALLPEESPNFEQKVSKNYLIIDIGAKRTSIVIYANKSIATSVSLPISGEGTTEKIAKTLEIDKEQAEKAKIICGLDKQKAQGVIYDILSEKIDKLLDGLNNAINFFYSQHNDMGKIDEIIICGGGSNIKELDRKIAESTKIKANRANIFTNLSEHHDKFNKFLKEKHYAKDKDKTLYSEQTSIYAYATTIGLALRNIFLKDE